MPWFFFYQISPLGELMPFRDYDDTPICSPMHAPRVRTLLQFHGLCVWVATAFGVLPAKCRTNRARRRYWIHIWRSYSKTGRSLRIRTQSRTLPHCGGLRRSWTGEALRLPHSDYFGDSDFPSCVIDPARKERLFNEYVLDHSSRFVGKLIAADLERMSSDCIGQIQNFPLLSSG